MKELNSDQLRPYGSDFVIESCAKEMFTPSEVKDMFELHFHETIKEKNQRTLSVEDRRFLKIMDQGIHKREDGHYKMPLPLKSEDVWLPNNKSQALRCLLQLKKRFKRDS